MTKPSEMPGWPDKAWYEEYFSAGMEHYERARADAWEARCRVAVEALQVMADKSTEWATRCVAKHTLSAIGPLPPLPPQQQRTGE